MIEFCRDNEGLLNIFEKKLGCDGPTLDAVSCEFYNYGSLNVMKFAKPTKADRGEGPRLVNSMFE